jgi:hypothetical protein
MGGDGVTMSNGMGCKGTESQQDLRGCLVDGSGLGRGIDPGRTGGIRGHWDEFTEEAVWLRGSCVLEGTKHGSKGGGMW